jgi:exodeoxyribonuclease VII large subunit
LQPATAASLQRAGTRLAILSARLDGKDPAAILQQGYAIVRRDGRAIRDARELAAGEAVEAQLWRGTFRARVEETQGDG